MAGFETKLTLSRTPVLYTVEVVPNTILMMSLLAIKPYEAYLTDTFKLSAPWDHSEVVAENWPK